MYDYIEYLYKEKNLICKLMFDSILLYFILDLLLLKIITINNIFLKISIVILISSTISFIFGYFVMMISSKNFKFNNLFKFKKNFIIYINQILDNQSDFMKEIVDKYQINNKEKLKIIIDNYKEENTTKKYS